MPTRFQLRWKKPWKTPHREKVDRTTPFGNPFPVTAKAPEENARVVELFRQWANAPERAEWRAMVRGKLRGKDLGCWCRPDWPCHADVLLRIANEVAA